jgi:hypothetical protein
MAVAVEMRFAGATLEQYDEVVSRMGFSPEGRGAKGGLFHWVTQTDDDIRVVDVWDTPEQFESFAKQTMRPLVAQVGISTEPELTFFPVHNYFAAG